MPFLRFSRDKRGYEHIYLVHATNRRGKPSRPRVLYWYRTPPGVKVGRKPFDEEIQRSLEAQYPGISFDWKAIIATPPPAPDPEYWRERRKLEKAVKQARRAAELEDVDAPPEGMTDEPSAEAVEDEPREVAEMEAPAEIADLDQATERVEVSGERSTVVPMPEHQAGSGRRRRRRGGRRRRGQLDALSPNSAESTRPDTRAFAGPPEVQEPVERQEPAESQEPDEPDEH